MGFTCHQGFRTKSGPLQVFKVYIAHTGLEHLVAFFWEGNCLSSIDPWPEKNRNFGDHRGEQLPLAGYFWLAYFRYHHFGVQKTGQDLPTFYHHSLLRGLNPRGKEATFNEKDFTTQRYQKIAHLSLAATPPPKKKKKHTHTRHPAVSTCLRKFW